MAIFYRKAKHSNINLTIIAINNKTFSSIYFELESLRAK